MDWLKGMNKVVAYIEENLTQPIEYEVPARIVGCSVYEFSRIFSFMTGISLSEYVRRRRLSQAVFDIQHSNMKIIDIAQKYCYDSPAAFTRAFKELHGTAPLSARKSGASLKNYPAIKFVLTIKGVNEMSFKIAEKPAFSVIGRKFYFQSWNDDDPPPNYLQDITQEQLDELLALSTNKNRGYFAMITHQYLGRNVGLIAVESTAQPPEGCVKFDIAASKWVEFDQPGDDTDMEERFHTEWLPSSGYSRASRIFPTIEIYGADHKLSGLWVPVDSAADVSRKFENAKAELKKLEAATPRGKAVDINLREMKPFPGDDVKQHLSMSYTDDGKMVLHTTIGDGRVGTPQAFTAPIKIEMRAKTDSTNLRLYYGESETNWHGAWIHLNGAGNDGEFYDGEALITNDLSCENEHYHENATRIPIDEFIDVEWILGRTVMAIKINGEVRVASTEYEYIEAFKQGFSVTGPVYPAPGRGSTITIERLRVTEL